MAFKSPIIFVLFLLLVVNAKNAQPPSSAIQPPPSAPIIPPKTPNRFIPSTPVSHTNPPKTTPHYAVSTVIYKPLLQAPITPIIREEHFCPIPTVSERTTASKHIHSVDGAGSSSYRKCFKPLNPTEMVLEVEAVEAKARKQDVKAERG